MLAKTLSAAIAVALLIAAAPVPLAMAHQAAPAAPAGDRQPASLACDAPIQTERTSLEAERTAINRTISDIAMGGAKSRARIGGGDVARHAAGTAASVFLPFGLGIAVNAAAALASKAEGKRKKAGGAAPPETDVPALIARVNAIEARLTQLKSACP